LTEVDLFIGINKDRNKTWNQTTPHKTKNNTTPHSRRRNHEKTHKKLYMWKSLIWL